MGSHYDPGTRPDDDTFRAALSSVAGTLRRTGSRALVMGGVGSASLARPRPTDDIDLFVHMEDAPALLASFEAEGFDVERTDPNWLFKAFHQGVLIDLIFRSTGDIIMDDDMLDHAQVRSYKGVDLPLVSPEDLLVIKAVAAAEHAPHHWYDALGLITRCDLDWAYLADRARRFGPRRVLSLLIYAESNDLAVPQDVLWDLLATVHPHVVAEHRPSLAASGAT